LVRNSSWKCGSVVWEKIRMDCSCFCHAIVVCGVVIWTTNTLLLKTYDAMPVLEFGGQVVAKFSNISS